MEIFPKCKITVVLLVILLVLALVCNDTNVYAKVKDTTLQVNGNAFVGQQNAKILSYKVILPAFSPQKTIYPSKFYFSTKGCTDVKDISSAHLYFTGSSDYTNLKINAADTAGQVFKSPNGSFTFSTTKALQPGNNYFLLTYDVSSGAKDANILDATLDSVMIQDTLRKVSSGNPTGSKLIDLYGTYCNVTVNIPNKKSPQYIGVRSVKIAKTINNNTGDLDKLTAFVTPKISVYRQESYSIEIKYGQGHNEQIIAWVDWNNDGFFDPITEEVFYSASNLSAETYKTNLVIPCYASNGTHKIRIMSDIDTIAKLSPCTNLRYGNAEEYIIDVQPDIKNIKPSMVLDDSAYFSSITYFTNTSNVNGNYTCEWAFNNSATYTATGDKVSYTFQPGSNTYGFKKVRMRLTWNGCDTTIVKVITDSIYLGKAYRPVASFIANQNIGDTSTIFQFTDLSTGRPAYWEWTITPSTINGAPAFTFLNGTNLSSQNPVIKFNRKGKYNIKLGIGNLYNSNNITKKSYIQVIDNIRMCDGHDTVTDATGYLSDDGGIGHPYQNNKSCFLVIKPPCSIELNLNFSDFDISALGYGNDGLKIYDSINNLGKRLFTGTTGLRNSMPGNNPLNPGTITAKSGTAYIEWNTDSSFTGDGFAAIWSSISKTENPPVAGFTAPTSVYIHHSVAFQNTSSGKGLQSFWDLNGDGTTDNNQMNPFFRYDSAGTFNVRLIVHNCGGVDTIFKRITVIKPTTKPKANFSASFYDITEGDQIQFTDLSTQAPYKWKWSILPMARSGKFEFIDCNVSSQNPSIKFKDYDSFQIQLVVSNDLGSDTMVKIIQVRQYCQPTAFSSHNVGISRVVLTNRVLDTLINQPSVKDTDYIYFSSLHPPGMVSNEKYNITVSRDSTGYAMNGYVWVNYAGDGVFKHYEQVLKVPNITGKTWHGTFTMSRANRPGISRIRIGVVYAKDSADPCGPNRLGEFQDYNIIQQADTVPPIITLKGNDTVIVEQNRKYIDAGAILFDAEDGDLSAYNLDSVSNVNTLLPGLYTVTYSGFDNVYNKAKPVSRTVIVIGDTSRPYFVLNGQQTVFVEVYNSYHEDSVRVFDNIDTSLSYSIINNIDTAHTGTYFVVYKSTDSHGNTGVLKRKIIVGDSIKPVITLLGKKTDSLQVFSHYNDPGVSTSDNYTKHLILKISKTLDSTKIGIQIITYTATDSAGNSASITRVVRVNNYIPPTLGFPFDTLNWDVNHAPFVHPMAQAVVSDIFYKLTSDNIYNLRNVDGNDYVVKPGIPGFYPLYYYAQTPSGIRSSLVKIIVHVLDRTSPTITMLGDTIVYLYRWEKYSDDQYCCIGDNYDPNAFLVEEPQNFIKARYPYIYFDEAGLYFINYYVQDHSGNISKKYLRWFSVSERADVENTSDVNSGFQYFPNPANDRLVYNFHAASPQQVSITISDMLQRPVINLFEGKTSEFSSEKDIRMLAAGIYTITVNVNNRNYSYKWIIAR